ncbi:TPA: hypothetical protein SMI01_004261 [Serratia marcescens]|nr:hypothetical protein [Serratia marcescens]
MMEMMIVGYDSPLLTIQMLEDLAAKGAEKSFEVQLNGDAQKVILPAGN